MTRLPVSLLFLVMACREPDEVTRALPRPTGSSEAPLAQGPASAPDASVSDAAGCAGLEKHECVLRPGCILDQTGPRTEVCRAARDACEASVRHGDLLGPTRSLPGVTPESQQRSIATCKAQPSCTLTSGKCSCPCAVMGDCNCACGGSYLPRCVRTQDAAALEGVIR